ncbi:alpha/beta hydrolase [Streptomyces avicenniae]|uniref:alpha/beta hydrolase n=1 Tax=Streptomyces avicenniae TaxID=500153 RepID=UPI000699333B|nr:alpha/beta hydrolase [Streptomyces avicenniae]
MTATPRSDAPSLTWTEPAGLLPRGTLVLLPGRGETPEVYRRFGSRLAADAYRVVAVRGGDDAPGDAAALVEAALADDTTPRPLVLVGSDTGALHALRLAARHGAAVDGVVLAGVPTRDADEQGDLDSEIAGRTACPNHRLVLAREATAGLRDTQGIPELLAALTPVDVPTLAVHGAADGVSPLPDAVALHRALGTSSLVAIEDGLHDILNDVTHRSVAATVVLFLERLRLGAQAPVIAREVPLGETALS